MLRSVNISHNILLFFSVRTQNHSKSIERGANINMSFNKIIILKFHSIFKKILIESVHEKLDAETSSL